MKKYFKEHIFSILTSFWALLNALMWLAMRVNYAGISKALGADSICKKYGLEETLSPTHFESFIVMYLGVIVCVVMFLLFIYTLLVLFLNKKKKKLPVIIGLIFNVIFTVAIIVVIILGSKDYMNFILPKFFKSLVISLCIIMFALLLFFPLQGKGALITKIAIMVIVITTAIFIGYDIKANYFTYDAVVYAVEDDYQIVFSTNDNSIAWITVDDTDYYDTYAGSMKSKDLVHKITIPQEKLDNMESPSYTIHARQLNYRGPFGAFYGKTIEKTYSFFPVDLSDGLTYFALSDVHDSKDAAVECIDNAGDIDFLVLAGDMVSDVEYESDAQYANYIASKSLCGEKPVIYARGNHECKGNYSEDLYKYVGSKDEKFYYYFTLANKQVYGIVLDLGEDHDTEDDWWEYYGTDQFDSYRQEQIGWLNTLDTSEMESNEYNLVICHIPMVFVNNRGDHEEEKTALTEIFNNLPIDTAIYGHQHELTPFVPGEVTPNSDLVRRSDWYEYAGTTYKGYLTDFNFYGFMVGRLSNEQNDVAEDHGTLTECAGLYVSVDLSSRVQTTSWKDINGVKIDVCNMWSDSDYKQDYIFNIHTK